MSTIQNNYRALPENPSYYELALIDNMGANHQPVVIVLDVSGSMNAREPGSSFTNIELLSKAINQIGSARELASYKTRVDMCVIQFSDNVTVVKDWIPLSKLELRLNLKAENTTAFFAGTFEGLMAARARVECYKIAGVRSYKPLVIIYTDGDPTDPEEFEAAFELVKRYVHTGRIGLLYMLLDGASKKAIERLDAGTDTIQTMYLKDAVNGLPASASFITSKIVDFASSMPGAKTRIKLSPYLATDKKHAIVDPDGDVAIEETTTMVNDSDIVWGGRA